jgi:hypothetical protein
VLKKWEERVGDKEEETAKNDIAARWEEYKNKIGNDTALKLVNHICGETGSTNDQKGKLLRQFLFVEIKGDKLESYLDEVVLEIQKRGNEKKAGQGMEITQDIAPLNSSPPSNKELPDFMEHLFNNTGSISNDGRVLKSLTDTAIEMRMKTKQKISPKQLKRLFRKSDGKEFSESQCKQAARTANSYPLPLDDSENSKKRKPLLANKVQS